MIEVKLPSGYPAFVFEEGELLIQASFHVNQKKYKQIMDGAATILINHNTGMEVVRNHNNKNKMTDEELLRFCDRKLFKVWDEDTSDRFKLMDI